MQVDPPSVQLKTLNNGTSFYMVGDTSQILYLRTNTPIAADGSCEVVGVMNGNKTTFGGTTAVQPAAVKVTPIV